ncbi:MAG: glyoxalase [Polaribacter sp.]|nr:glyoxalase [Polaribacter sp.]
MNKERPVLENLIKEHMSAIELFQNQTLRPVIKMQHDLLIASFSNYIQKRNIDFLSLTDSKKRSKISAVFGKDIHYKNFILGIVVGHFSTEEYQYYRFNSSELNKRILQIVVQRVQDSLEQII